jgi:hypothetical protein
MGMVTLSLDHVADMLNDVVFKKKIPAAKVFMDSWYAAQKLMALHSQRASFTLPNSLSPNITI